MRRRRRSYLRGNLHAALVKLNSSEEVVAVLAGREALTRKDLLPAYTHIRDTLLVLEDAYGGIDLVKRYPDVVWGDTLVVDRVTQQQVPIADRSQWVELHSASPVSLNEVAARLQTLPEVAYVDAPFLPHRNADLDLIQPDDGEYQAQWDLGTVNAAEAWALGAPSRVRLAVYDVLGREVAVLADGPHAAGRHEATLDGHGLAAGRYLVRLTAGEAVVSAQLTRLSP